MPKAERDTLFTAAPLPVAPLDDAGRLACLRLIRSENVGPATFRELINHYGGAEQALEALPELSRRGGSGRAIRICPRDQALAELEAARRIGARAIVTIEPGYPPALAATAMPPPLVYVRGEVALLQQPMLAIVGSRDASAAGHRIARMLAKQLGRAGLVIASGLARGIDRAAHEASLDTGTVAVVAGGADVVYPPEHAALQDEIARRGSVITEMPPGFVPRAQEFPRRNRIIAGVAYGVLVVEAARRSGTLVTARLANELGREVLAIPGHPLDPRAEGTNRLIKQGATMVTEADDVLQVLAPILGKGFLGKGFAERDEAPPAEADAAPALPEPPPLLAAADRERLLSALGPVPIDVDELVRTTGLGLRAVQVLLIELALAGRIERHGGQLVSLAPAG